MRDEFARIDGHNTMIYHMKRLQWGIASRATNYVVTETWHLDSLCAKSEENYWDSAKDIELARPICAKCPVQSPCLDQGLRENIPQGGRDFPTYAGYTGEQLYELKQLNKKLRKARRDPA